MSYIKTTTIQTVAVLLFMLIASTPASASGRNSELLIDEVLGVGPRQVVDIAEKML